MEGATKSVRVAFRPQVVKQKHRGLLSHLVRQLNTKHPLQSNNSVRRMLFATFVVSQYNTVPHRRANCLHLTLPMIPSSCLAWLHSLDSMLHSSGQICRPRLRSVFCPILRFGAPFSADRPRLRSNPARLRGYRLSDATCCKPCILLASLGSTTRTTSPCKPMVSA